MQIKMTCLTGPTGIAACSHNYYKLFNKYNIQTKPIWIDEPSIFDKLSMEDGLFAKMNQEPDQEDFIQFHVGRSDVQDVLKNRKLGLISFVVEGNCLTPNQIQTALSNDAVFYTSSFVANSYLNSGLPKSKLYYLSNPLDFNLWDRDKYPKSKRDTFNFMFINTWYQRKGYDLLLKAWWEEFNFNDPVKLIIKSKSENGFIIKEEINKLAKQYEIDLNKTAPIEVLDEYLTTNQLVEFISKNADAIVSPHRSEGFGMNVWHGMALNIPIICTNYGGVTDFAKSETSWLVKVDGLEQPSEKEKKTYPHLGNIVWASPSLEDLKIKMRECLKNMAERELRAKKAYELVKHKYSYEKIFNDFKSNIKSISPDIYDQLFV